MLGRTNIKFQPKPEQTRSVSTEITVLSRCERREAENIFSVDNANCRREKYRTKTRNQATQGEARKGDVVTGGSTGRYRSFRFSGEAKSFCVWGGVQLPGDRNEVTGRRSEVAREISNPLDEEIDG